MLWILRDGGLEVERPALSRVASSNLVNELGLAKWIKLLLKLIIRYVCLICLQIIDVRVIIGIPIPDDLFLIVLISWNWLRNFRHLVIILYFAINFILNLLDWNWRDWRRDRCCIIRSLTWSAPRVRCVDLPKNVRHIDVILVTPLSQRGLGDLRGLRIRIVLYILICRLRSVECILGL